MGFIGLQVARELAASDEVVLGYNRSLVPDDELKETLGPGFRTARVDIGSPYSLARVVAEHDIDSIVHLAVPGLGATPPAEEALTNVTGLVNVLEAARVAGARRVSVASSVAVYSGLPGGPFSEDLPLPVNSTSATSAMKKAEEILALHYADRTGLDVVLLRIAIVYGPRYRTLSNLAGRLTYQAVKGSLPGHTGAPWTTSALPSGLDLCHVADCATAIARVHTADDVAHRIYNVGAGHNATVPELLDAVAAAIPGAVLPDELRSLASLSRPEAHMDITRLRTEFAFEPQFSIQTGIGDYADWLKTHDR
jgi:UDP-glucose 4-epimerase